VRETFHRVYPASKITRAGSLDSAIAALKMTVRYLAAPIALVRRALRRFAALRPMMPRLAALSIAEMIARISLPFGAGAERIRFCRFRTCALMLRFRSARLCVWRERLAADLVLAIADQKSRCHKDLLDASFAFCRAPASAPAVRIWSTLSEPEGGVASVVALICGAGFGITFAATTPPLVS